MTPFLYPLIALVAAVYASVGHGGASGYLAVLSLFGFHPKEMAPSALALNLLVAGCSFIAYLRAGHFRWGLFWPFALASIPAALLGGLLEVSTRSYAWLFTGALVFAAFRLSELGQNPGPSEEAPRAFAPLKAALPAGAAIGLLSGIVGVGGGIFLSPLLILLRWADAKSTAAVSAAFILVNSAAALYGHIARRGLEWTGLWPLIAAAFLGGLAGSCLGANRFSGRTLRRVLAAVLVIAAYKMLRLALAP